VSTERPAVSDDDLAADEAAGSGTTLDGGVPDERDAEAGQAEAQSDRTSQGSTARVVGAGEVQGGTDHPRDAPSGSADEHGAT
jgi:hypothetical protein